MKQFFHTRRLFKAQALAGILVFGSGIGCGAADLQSQSEEVTAAAERVDQARTRVEQARKQVEASRALLRAFEAEYRAALANKEALSLRNHARKLADASGLPKEISPPSTAPAIMPQIPAVRAGKLDFNHDLQPAPAGQLVPASQPMSAPTPGQ
ncbi:MAG TPA: hypothetical protein V6D17_23815 [Candidatus Obscuribacterales bacterium]